MSQRDHNQKQDQVREAGISTSVFDASATNEAEWKAILRELEEEYQLNIEGSLKNGVRGYFRGIDEGINLQSERFLDGSPVRVRPEDFRPFEVEALLDQAGNLLDRGIRDRAEWDEYSVRAFDLIVDLKEYSGLEDIHKREEAAGYYEWLAAQTRYEAEAEQQAVAGTKAVAAILTDLIKYRRDQEPALLEVIKRAAHLSPFPVLFYDRPSQRHKDIRNPANEGLVSDALTTWEYNGKEYKPHEEMEKAAGAQVQFDNETQDRALQAEEESLKAAQQIAEFRRQAAEARANWEAANKEFSKEKTRLTIALQRMRAAAVEAEGGALNYKERMDPLKLRYERDFRDATARMVPAAKGLREIFGYSVPLPTDPFPPASLTPRKFYDECLVWVRDAISFLIRFSQADQNYIQPISLRNVLGEAEWANGKARRNWKVTLTESTFKNIYGEEQYHVRLRGISVFVIHHDPNGIWHVKVIPPRSGLSRHLPGLPGHTTPITLDQNNVPSCRFGRATHRDHPRDPDVVGVASLYNVSPLGEWTVSINERDFGGHSVTEIEDIQLDLHLAFRSS